MHSPQSTKALFSPAMVLYSNSSSSRPAFDSSAPLKFESQTLRYMRACVQASANRKHMHQKGSKATKFTIEQARRKSIIKLTTNMMTFALARPPPPQIKQEDKDSATLDKDKSLPKTLDLPLYLGLPEYEEVPQASIEAVDPSLVDTSVGYIRDTLIKFAISPGYAGRLTIFLLSADSFLHTACICLCRGALPKTAAS